MDVYLNATEAFDDMSKGKKAIVDLGKVISEASIENKKILVDCVGEIRHMDQAMRSRIENFFNGGVGYKKNLLAVADGFYHPEIGQFFTAFINWRYNNLSPAEKEELEGKRAKSLRGFRRKAQRTKRQAWKIVGDGSKNYSLDEIRWVLSSQETKPIDFLVKNGPVLGDDDEGDCDYSWILHFIDLQTDKIEAISQVLRSQHPGAVAELAETTVPGGAKGYNYILHYLDHCKNRDDFLDAIGQILKSQRKSAIMVLIQYAPRRKKYRNWLQYFLAKHPDREAAEEQVRSSHCKKAIEELPSYRDSRKKNRSRFFKAAPRATASSDDEEDSDALIFG